MKRLAAMRATLAALNTTLATKVQIVAVITAALATTADVKSDLGVKVDA